MINPKRTVDSCNPALTKSFLAISLEMTVHELESIFLNELGLYIQVFRKSGRVWLETTATDSWSLQKQNTEGQELSNDTAVGNEEELPDYQEQP